MRRSCYAIVVACIATIAPAASAAEFEACRADDAERIRWIESRLEERRTYANYWWMGWTGAYGIGTIVQSVQAGTEDRDGRQADYVVSAVKALFGTSRLLLWPNNARRGADEMREIAAVDDASCRLRLAKGEELMQENAAESEERWDWKRHALNVAVNVAGGVIVAEGWDESRGWTSMGVGIAVGEAMVFSAPWKADEDLEEYRQRFDGSTSGQRVSFSIAPWHNGARIQLKF